MVEKWRRSRTRNLFRFRARKRLSQAAQACCLDAGSRNFPDFLPKPERQAVVSVSQRHQRERGQCFRGPAQSAGALGAVAGYRPVAALKGG